MNYSINAREGDLAQLVGLTHKHFIFILQPGGDFQSHRGVIKHDDLIGKPWGSQVYSLTGVQSHGCTLLFTTAFHRGYS